MAVKKRKTINSRERVISAINHQTHDRVPVDIGGTFVTGFTASAYEKVRHKLGINSGPIRICEPGEMLAEIEQPVIEALDIDTIGLGLEGGDFHGWQDWIMPDGIKVKMPNNLELKKSSSGAWHLYQNGLHTSTMPAEGYYFDSVSYEKYRDYDPAALTDKVLRNIQERCRYFYKTTDKAIILHVPYCIFNGPSPDFLMALMIEKNEVHERLNIWTNHILQCLKLLLDAVKGFVDIMVFPGDAGAQNAPLVSPDLHREMIVPHFKKIPEYLHKNSNIKFFYHTCGSVYKLIENFIEMKVDILNPLQCSAANMEPERLVNEFGGRIVFWGGGCDAQQILSHGTEEDVRNDVKNRLEYYTTIPGFVFSADHNLQPDVPVENIFAMVDEVKKWKFKTGDGARWQ